MYLTNEELSLIVMIIHCGCVQKFNGSCTQDATMRWPITVAAARQATVIGHSVAASCVQEPLELYYPVSFASDVCLIEKKEC